MLNLSSLHIDLHLNEAKDTTYPRTPFGKEMLKHFNFDPAYRNMNHGKYTFLHMTHAAHSLPRFLW